MIKAQKLFILFFVFQFLLNLNAKADINDIIYADKDLIAHIHLKTNLKDKLQDIENIKSFDFDVAGIDRKENILDLVINELEIPLLKSLGYNFEIDWSNRYLKSVPSQYKTPEEISIILHTWAEKYPELVTLFEVGKSTEGRIIWGVRLTSSDKNNSNKKPSILFNGLHHAREVMSPEAVLDIGQYILEHSLNTQSKKVVQNWLENVNIYLVPMINVDGSHKVWSGSTMWRKNTAYGYGVDLNRNYPYKWGKCNGSSGSRYSQTYRGPYEASESETQAMMNLIAKIRPVFDISYHSYSELVLYPLGCKGEKVKNIAISSIGKTMGTEILYDSGTPWEILYGVDGADIDWMYTTYNVVPYVLELNKRSQGFRPDYDKWRDQTVERVRPAWMLLLNRMISNQIYSGRLTYKNVSNIKMNVYKDNTLIESYLPHENGQYFIILNSGEYSLKIVQGRAILEEKIINIQ